MGKDASVQGMEDIIQTLWGCKVYPYAEPESLYLHQGEAGLSFSKAYTPIRQHEQEAPGGRP